MPYATISFSICTDLDLLSFDLRIALTVIPDVDNLFSKFGRCMVFFIVELTEYRLADGVKHNAA